MTDDETDEDVAKAMAVNSSGNSWLERFIGGYYPAFSAFEKSGETIEQQVDFDAERNLATRASRFALFVTRKNPHFGERITPDLCEKVLQKREPEIVQNAAEKTEENEMPSLARPVARNSR